MADFEQALTAALGATPGVTDAVGANISPVRIPEDAPTPALCYAIRSKPRPQGLDGPNGLAVATVVFTARSNRETAYADVKAVTQAIRAAFGSLLNADVGGVFVLRSIVKDDSDDYVDAPDGSDSGTYEEPVTIVFTYREP
jgi:hypothetical protein